ncbi:putative ribonuclease H-like domain-containing protein [Tanacetum coccineum]
MIGNKCYLDEYEDYDGGLVSFGDGKGRISGKGKIKTGTLDFEDVYFCKELKYNLFSVSQICDKKNNVLFTDTECLVLSSDFKLLDESQVLLKVPRKDNIYSVDLKSVVPTGDLTCLIAKATIDESNTWHRRLGHINFKTMNKLVKGNLVKGLPSKIFENDHSCVACQKGKQHKASYKTKLVNSISKPLHMLHMDLFGPTNVKSLMKKSYCLVVTDDFSRFSWVFFLATKDETSGILKTFITEIENQLDHKVKVIRSDNGTEFKNSIMNQFCEIKGIKREFSVARTPQQNGVAERKNRTLIEAARTMLVDSKLPTTFWAEAVNTACYVLNRVLVIKPHNKTPYELIRGRPPLIDFMKPFGCPVTILNTRDHLGKFDGKADEGYFVGYSVVSKAMRVFNKRTRIVEETLNIRFLENTPNVKGNGPDWLFDVDSLSISMNYVPVATGNKLMVLQEPKITLSMDCEGDARMKPIEVEELIKNRNKVLRRTVGTVEHVYEPTTAEEKHDRRNEMKARATLLMALPNKDQLKFHSYQDAKLLMEAIEKRYGRNRESKKEDINLKLLRSLPSEWKTHALIWRNKVEIETISLDDLYNNLKIYELEIIDDTVHGVSTTHSTTHTQDLEQLHPYDLEEMDLQWEMAMLTIRARRFIKRTGKKLDINGQRVGFDKSKVECFNCHKHKHDNSKVVAWPRRVPLLSCLLSRNLRR